MRARNSATPAAFELGAGTNFVILPSADVAIVALTNATPSGVPETLTAQFADLVQFGEVREDWYEPLQRGSSPKWRSPVGSLVGKQPPAKPGARRAVADLRRHLQQRLLGPGASHREGRQAAAGARLEAERPAGALGRQRLHLQVRHRKCAAWNDFQGDVRRRQADARVLTTTSRRGRSSDERLREEKSAQ